MNFKKILVAVDASDNALRAVEYTGRMIGCLACAGPDPARTFTITLLYVERLPDRDIFPDENSWKQSCAEHRETMKAFLAKAESHLLGIGLHRETVETNYLVSCRSPESDGSACCGQGTSIAHEILRVLKDGDYGTAVVGRRGASKAEEFLFGSVSSKIIHSAKDCTVWVVA